MPTVTFLPAETTVEVPAGTLIHEAAILAGVEDLHLPCGAKGTCGQCLVEVVSGSAEQFGHTHFDEVLAGERLVMACMTQVRDDLVIRIRDTHDAAMRVVGDSHFLINAKYLPDRHNLSPVVRIERVTVPPASIDEHYSDWRRLTRAVNPDNRYAVVQTDLRVLHTLAEALRAEDGQVAVVLKEDACGALRVMEVLPTDGRIQALGLAIDIGTTTVAVQLINLLDSKVLANRAGYNGQLRRGTDVISRIDYVRTPERSAELRDLVLESINQLVEEIIAELDIDPQTIHAAFIAGNTTMIHLLLGLPPRYIRETPYVPTVNTVPSLLAAEVGLAINPQAVVSFAPGVGSYVGGDVIAGLICTEIPVNHDEVFLFMDIGTNGEIVLGNADWMIACACSAGPAFEGAGIKCGMRATDGAIEYLELDPTGRHVRYDVIGEGKPAGICGSGLICLLGELLLHGIIDQSGRLNMELPSDRLVRVGNSNAFVLEWAEHTRDGADLLISEPDIENLMRTKAAIYAACDRILQNVGIDWQSVARVFIAGGFGRYIQVEDAILIGLLPDLPYDRFTYLGNSSLTGAYIALLSREKRHLLAKLAHTITYVDLSSDTHYMDSFLGALFLPHTELTQFPTVAEKLAALRG
jgi:uncharacterized 2Fe-2S/4Fe-4S cluster protein (DUF4445 family)